MSAERTFFSVAADCERCVAAIEEAVATLLAESFPSSTARDFGKLVRSLAQFLRDRTARIVAKYYKASESQISAAVGQLFSIDEFIKRLAEDLEHLEAAVTSKVPWSLVETFEDLSNQVIPGSAILLRPLWEYNYCISLANSREHYEKMVSVLLTGEEDAFAKAEKEKLFSDFPARFHIVYFPYLEQKSVLLHGLLGHEIGHTVAQAFLKSEDQAKLRPRVEEAVERVQAKEGSGRTLLAPEERAEIFEEIMLIRRRGLEELISDLVGTRLFGPTLLFAFSEFTKTLLLDAVPSPLSDYYPPWRYRMRKVLGWLKKSRFLPINKDCMIPPPDPGYFLPKIEDEIAEIDQTTRIEQDLDYIKAVPRVEVSYDLISEIEDSIWTFVESKLGTKACITKNLYRHVPYVIARLHAKIPPTAIEDDPTNPTPIPLETILCGAWFYRLSHFPFPVVDGKISEKFAAESDIMNRLVLFAIEMSRLVGLR